MKNLLLFFLVLFMIEPAYSQNSTRVVSSGESATLGGVTLRRTRDGGLISIDNPKNMKGNLPYVRLDGTAVTDSPENYRIDDVPAVGFERAMASTFSQAERLNLRKTQEKVYIFFVFDSAGRVLEVDFTMDDNARLQNIPLSKFIVWSNNLKKYVTAKITDPRTKQLQFVHLWMQCSF